MPFESLARVDAKLRRREQRFPVRLPAVIRSGPGYVTAVLCDLSRNGALAQSSNPPHAGHAVILRCGDIESAARVAWVEGRRFGLTFLAPIRVTALFVAMNRSRMQ
jgi:hypothetical protein